MTKADSDRCKLPLEIVEKDKEEIEEVTVSPADAKEIIDVAVEVVYWEGLHFHI